jgi:hypothetical protein
MALGLMSDFEMLCLLLATVYAEGTVGVDARFILSSFLINVKIGLSQKITRNSAHYNQAIPQSESFTFSIISQIMNALFCKLGTVT